MNIPDVVGFDFETYLIGPESVIPAPICLTVQKNDDSTEIFVLDDIPDGLLNLFQTRPKTILVGHYTAFDLNVITSQDKTLIPTVLQKLTNGEIYDTKVAEMLLNLTEHGSIDFVSDGDSPRPIRYTLSALVKKYLGVDISEDKKSEDAWRTNYDALVDIPVDEWPEEAILYAKKDAIYPVLIKEKQEEERNRILGLTGHDPFACLKFRTYLSYVLYFITGIGIKIDKEKKKEIEKHFLELNDIGNFPDLVNEKILIPRVPPQPYINGATDADGNVKMKKAVPEKISKKALVEHVKRLAEKIPDLELEYTPKNQITVNKNWLEKNYGFSKVLTQYHDRQKLQKIITTEIPRMNWNGHTADYVYPSYSELKVTGRISSYSSTLYPSANIQQIDPRVRPCYIPRDGYVMFSVDYSQMELCTLAQKCLDLFGESVLATKINDKVDTHAYLGAQLAHNLDQDFANEVEEYFGLDLDIDNIFMLFEAYKYGSEKEKKFYKHYRTFAKPTGLGYPGGLGPETFITYAKGSYGIDVDLGTAKLLRDIYFKTYPEVKRYLREWVPTQIDPRHRRYSKIDGKYWDTYQYTTPMGMFRPNCDYCAISNGAALQSPSSEGALYGLCNVFNNTVNEETNSALLNKVNILGFIHDEILGEVLDIPEKGEIVKEIQKIMELSFTKVVPDVLVSSEAKLMKYWSKSAEPVFDKKGNLLVWEDTSETQNTADATKNTK